jgi:hypothetical protein
MVGPHFPIETSKGRLHMTSELNNSKPELTALRLAGAALRIDTDQMGRDDTALQKHNGSIAALCVDRGEDVSVVTRRLVGMGLIGQDDPRAVAAQEASGAKVDISDEGRVAFLGAASERITDLLKDDLDRDTRVKLMTARHAVRAGDFNPARVAETFEGLASQAASEGNTDLASKAAGGFAQATKVAVMLQKQAPIRQKDAGRDR